MNSLVIWLPVVLYLAGWLGEFVRNWSFGGGRPRWGPGVLAVAWGAHTVLLVMLGLESLSALPTVLAGVAWLAVAVYHLVARRLPGDAAHFVLPPLTIALLIAAFVNEQGAGLPGDAARLVLTVHIIAVLAGFLLFAMACLFSIFYLLQERALKHKQAAPLMRRLPSLGALEHHNHRAVMLGFFFLTVGIFLGLAVAGLETLEQRVFTLRQLVPAAVWLLYAAFLLFHDLQGRRGRFGVLWSIVGFLVVLLSLVMEIAIVAGRPLTANAPHEPARPAAQAAPAPPGSGGYTAWLR